ncbi:MAG: sulfur oxidation c-type cytochrome SoxA [Gammaproteobacteria bacterium]|nr:sulfur oxidation c-type cytochrome SoxA [Gammaproteobacteria bacterium]
MKLTNSLFLSNLGFFILLTVGSVYAEPRSGYEFVKSETRAMQDDDFANPGLLTVDHGEELFNQKHKNSGKSCASCHGEEGEKLNSKEIARYPVYNSKLNKIVTLQKRISNCRSSITDKQLLTNHPDLVALETFVRNRAAGEKVNVQMDGAVSQLLKKGEKLYKTRYGLIDMSCYHCHTLYPGKMIRGQKISQGQGNGFPAYRLDTGEVTNLNQRIQQCMTLLRAEPFDADSEENKLLGLYIMSRSNGLVIETPAVRY